MSHALIIGASGGVGSVVAAELAARGHVVRRATRTPRAAADVQLDLVSGAGLRSAFDAVDRVFLMAPPGHMQQDRLLAPLIDAAAASGVRRVVLMTAMGVDADPTAGLRLAELHLARSGLSHAVVRPNWFMQNFHTYWMGSISATGEVQLPVGDARASFIDARDIGAVAAELLHRDADAQGAFDLTGPEAIDHATAVAEISAASGWEIGFRDVPAETLRAGLLAAGLSADYADYLLKLLGYLRAGYAERVTSTVRDVLGRAPRRFADYARDHAAAWRG